MSLTKKIHVVATDGFDIEAQDLLRQESTIHLDVFQGIKGAQLSQVLENAHLVIVRSATEIKDPLVSSLKKLRGVVRAGVGIDNIDLTACTRLGISVWNAPTGNYQSAAELAVALIFATNRRLALAIDGARRGEWLKKEISQYSHQLAGNTLGVFGAGNIGLRVARMMRGMGMDVVICDPYCNPASRDMQFSYVDFDVLLSKSDVISIHVPITESTKHIFNLAAFKKMKKHACIVNAARGGVVKDADLAEALRLGFIGGAGLDVFEVEPFAPQDPVYRYLLQDERVVATPHVGASTLEAQRLVGLETASLVKKIASVWKGTTTDSLPLAINASKVQV